jgi:ADP-heptose:LPS heptosyltransferase
VTRLLVARLDSAGDVLLTGPAVRALAAATEVTYLCGPRGRAAAELLPGVTDLITWWCPWIDAEPPPVREADVDRLVVRLRGRFDAAVVLTSFHQSPLPLALLLRLAGVPTIAATSEDFPGTLVDVRVRPDDGVHEVERSLRVVEALGHRLPPADDDRLRVQLLPRQLPPGPLLAPGYVVVHPGASVPARQWPAERHAELVRLLAAAGYRVVVTGARAERELAAAVAGPPRPGVLNLCGATSMPALAAVLAGADVVVTGNTGPMHLAAAVGAPVVALYAPTVPARRWHPWRVPHVLLGDQGIPCAGCRARECPVAGHPCLDEVPAERALAAVERLSLERTAAEPAEAVAG